MRIFGNSAKNSAKLETPARISQIDVLLCQNRAKHSECFQKKSIRKKSIRNLDCYYVTRILVLVSKHTKQNQEPFVVKLHFDTAKNELSEIENLIL